MKHEYNITVEDIKKLTGGVRDKAAARARKAFAKMVASNESIVDPGLLRDRCKSLVGVAPGWDALVELTNKVQAARINANLARLNTNATPVDKAVKKVDDLALLKSDVEALRGQIADLIALVTEYVTKPTVVNVSQTQKVDEQVVKSN